MRVSTRRNAARVAAATSVALLVPLVVATESAEAAPAGAPAAIAAAAPAKKMTRAQVKHRRAVHKRAALVKFAKKKKRTGQYVAGASRSNAFDCSGFTSYVLKEMGVTVPRTARQQGTVGTEVPSLEQARPGDLLILNGGTHVGIYIGADQYMHAPRPGEQVKIGKIYGDIDTIL